MIPDTIRRLRIVNNVSEISELTQMVISRYNEVYGTSKMIPKTVEELEQDASKLKEKLSTLNISPGQLQIYYQQVDEIKEFYVGMLDDKITK